MASSQGSLISASDFISLKAAVKKEIQRRSDSSGKGSMSQYAGTAYDYTITPASGGTILDEHIKKITEPLDAVAGTSLTPANGSYVLSTQLINATNKLSELSSKATNASSSNSGCKSSCSGLCSTGCYSGCSGCSGDCNDSCDDNCGTSCTNQLMSGNCSGTCYGSSKGRSYVASGDTTSDDSESI